MIKKILLTLFCFALSVWSFSQDTIPEISEPATGMRSNEKIYVVVAVLCTILAGLIIYVIRIDKKISRMEKNS